ncbi:hypothetical protein OF83DRAFT_1068449, partial [Amylostereum chailletii]
LVVNSVNRLQPGRYLNDELVNFGLQLWFTDLKEGNPELEEDIHVFSTFFFQNLSGDS